MYTHPSPRPHPEAAPLHAHLSRHGYDHLRIRRNAALGLAAAYALIVLLSLLLGL